MYELVLAIAGLTLTLNFKVIMFQTSAISVDEGLPYKNG